MIAEGGLELGDAVGQLMANNVQAFRESYKHNAVAVAVNHLRPVPEGVVVVTRVMDRGIESHAISVNGISAEDLLEKIVGRAGVVVGFVDVTVFGLGIAFVANQGAGQARPMVEVVDGAAL